jgi:hypothetical protein
MARRARSWLWVALLAQVLAGCSLIFPFGVTGVDGGGGGQGDAADAAIVDVVVHEGSGPGSESSQGDGAGDGAGGGDGPFAPDAVVKPDGTSCPACSYPSWCLANPTTHALNAVWGDTLSNLWAVGDQGTVLGYDPGSCAWKSVDADLLKDLGTADHKKIKARQLRGVWGVGKLIFVVGDAGTVMRYNGASWTLEPLSVSTSDHFYAVGGDAASTQLFAVGTGGKLYHRAFGGTWVPWSTGITQTLKGVSGLTSTSPGPGQKAIYVVGGYGEVLYHDGSVYQDFTGLNAKDCSTTLYWEAVWASPTTPTKPAPELVAVASSGEVLHYHSGTASCTVVPTFNAKMLYGLDGIKADDLWTVGRNGFVGRGLKGSWTSVKQTKTTSHLWAVHVLEGPPRRVVAVGAGGVVLQTTY